MEVSLGSQEGEEGVVQGIVGKREGIREEGGG